MATPTADQTNFLDEWAELGGPIAKQHDLPVSAMLALASVESNWGKGDIFAATLNPFNLQKWEHIPYPITHMVIWRWTVIDNVTRERKKAPFNCAMSCADAVRQWCEWLFHYGEADGPPQDGPTKTRHIIHGPQIAARVALLMLRKDPAAFAAKLYTVGFGKPVRATGVAFATRLTDYSLTRYD